MFSFQQRNGIHRLSQTIQISINRLIDVVPRSISLFPLSHALYMLPATADLHIHKHVRAHAQLARAVAFEEFRGDLRVAGSGGALKRAGG